MSINLLGMNTSYPTRYAPELLFAIPRMANRNRLGWDSRKLPFCGYDIWRAYEVSWLNRRGKPVAAIGELIIPCNSPNMVESKSFKLYLNSLNQHQFSDITSVESLLVSDLSQLLGTTVSVRLFPVACRTELNLIDPPGVCLDDLEVDIGCYTPAPQFLSHRSDRILTETLYTELFRSNCPVTFQPDWGTVVISYTGVELDRGGLLSYLMSYRCHDGFHEDCAEQIFRDLSANLSIQSLTVSINFLRRGGLEINPVRSSYEQPSTLLGRFVRQ